MITREDAYYDDEDDGIKCHCGGKVNYIPGTRLEPAERHCTKCGCNWQEGYGYELCDEAEEYGDM